MGEEDAESEHEEEDIFELEGQTEHLHLGSPAGSREGEEGTPREPDDARLVGRGGWEGAACGGLGCLPSGGCVGGQRQRAV